MAGHEQQPQHLVPEILNAGLGLRLIDLLQDLLTMAYGPQAGLDLLDELQHDPALRHYHLLPSVRADVLLRLGRRREAGEQFLAAAALCANDQERALLRERALRCQEDADGAGS